MLLSLKVLLELSALLVRDVTTAAEKGSAACVSPEVVFHVKNPIDAFLATGLPADEHIVESVGVGVAVGHASVDASITFTELPLLIGATSWAKEVLLGELDLFDRRLNHLSYRKYFNI